MPGTLHAIALIAGLLVAGGALVALPRRQPSGREATRAFMIGVAAMIVTFLLNQHLCREGVPVKQWLLPGAGLIFVLGYVKHAAYRRTVAALLLVAMLGLSHHFNHLVHQDGWTGSRTWLVTDHPVNRGNLRMVQGELLEIATDPNTVFTAGWLRNLAWPADESIEPIRSVRVFPRRDVHRKWHTSLTGLYRYTEVPRDFWYPGGTLAEAVPRIELRDRLRQAPPSDEAISPGLLGLRIHRLGSGSRVVSAAMRCSNSLRR